MNDFLTDDFVNKNIRVRPNSGKSEGKEMQSYGSKAALNNDTGKDESEEQIIHLELDEARRNIKRNAKDKEEEQVRRLKALEKEGKK